MSKSRLRLRRLVMASSWITCKISDVAEVVGGGTPSTKNAAYYGGDISWITPKDLSGYTEQYICKGERNITPLGLEKSSAKLLPKGAILFSSRAPIGYVAIAENPLSTNQGFKSIVPKDGKLDSLFGYYLMKYYASEIERHASGSTFKEVSGSVVKNFDIKLPSCISMQKSIASILSSVDEKIANNTAMNQTLEKIAQRIFKSWFIDFDPVRANKEGVAFDGLSPEIQALFPSEFEESELGMIPKTWGVSSLSERVNINPKRTLKKGIVTHHIDMKALPTSSMSISEVAEKEFKSGTKFQNHDTLLARITPCLENGKTAYVNCIPENEIAWGSTEFIVMNPKLKFFREYVYLLARTEELRAYAIKNMTGTSGRQRVSGALVGEYLIVNPSDTIVEEFHRIAEPLFSKIAENTKSTVVLEKIRDRLLPKLISGQITVGEAQKELAEAI